MFKDLQNNPQKNLLPELPKTVSDLQLIGREAMTDPGDTIKGIPVPAVHTFLAQFIDHDITLMDDTGAQISLTTPTVLSQKQIDKIVNARSPDLDLDNVYGPNIRKELDPPKGDDPRKMKIEKVEGTEFPKGVNEDGWHDFPRLDDGTPLIGDSRDAENLILAQLHIAFLRAHNAIVDERQCDFKEARKILTQHYQCIVLNDFLEQICDPCIVKRIIDEGPKFFPRPNESFYMPLEFSVAAYRFGHSKVRAAYGHFNSLQDNGGLGLLFGFTDQRLTANWVISWPSFLDTGNQERLPRRIDTTLSDRLLFLDEVLLDGHDIGVKNLAVRNLLRGYMLRMPTGQAVAEAMGIQPVTREEIKSVAMQIPVPPNKTQADYLEKTDFLDKTPLWFYILAEAAFGGGVRLGPVGSTIVAEVLIGVLRNSTDSILTDPGWKGPTLKRKTPDKFDIGDLLNFAGVL